MFIIIVLLEQQPTAGDVFHLSLTFLPTNACNTMCRSAKAALLAKRQQTAIKKRVLTLLYVKVASPANCRKAHKLYENDLQSYVFNISTDFRGKKTTLDLLPH